MSNNKEKTTFYRFEFKYPIPRHMLGSLADDLLKIGCERDRPEYGVSSVYFESPTMVDYMDKLGGWLDRKKLRARIYHPDHDNLIWLEIKEKHDMMIWKRRVAITVHEWQLLNQSPHQAYEVIILRLNTKERRIFQSFMFFMHAQNRRPYVQIEYKRQAFMYYYAGGHVRITLDAELNAGHTTNFDKACTTKIDPTGAVVELKFTTHIPGPIARLLPHYHLIRSAYSKYADSIQELHRYIAISQ